MGKIERWIRQKLGAAVAAGIGEWAASPTSVLGKPIYKFADGSMTLTLSDLGFIYAGPTPAIERRYDEVEALKLAPLVTIMKLRGDLIAPITIGVIFRGAPVPLEMRLPLCVYSNVAAVLDRIVTELA